MSRTVQRYARELLRLCHGKEKADVERTIERFVGLLIERRQGSLLPEILEAVESTPEYGTVEVTMTTAEALDGTASENFRERLEKKLDTPVYLTNATDPSLIGGATLRYEDILFDGSLRARLDALKRQLSN